MNFMPCTHLGKMTNNSHQSIGVSSTHENVAADYYIFSGVLVTRDELELRIHC